MSDPLAKIVRVVSVEDHPRKPHLSVFLFEGKQVVAMKVDDRHRYDVGSLIGFIRHNARVSEAINHHFGLEKGRVKAANFDKVRSDGIHLPTIIEDGHTYIVDETTGRKLAVGEGDDVSDFLGIVEYIPGSK